MSWSIGYDRHWNRDIGYGVPAICDHPECNEKIDRGLSYVCMSEEPHGGDGCGLYFCWKHLTTCGCERCAAGDPPFQPKPDSSEWVEWKLTDESWAQWRAENPDEVAKLKGGAA
ncbi:hypothetical protein KDM87_07030 [Undibacterium sp. FT147W]|uniref:Uncharacterized protein n=1 Tax=Undibacterium rivi TaxID=2828729 RepID=A0ABS5H0W1_9BURK|nr:hypothetical protein [Undibacterium rivi]MBR7792350.1 hypothetical protein [Undibacterium rivi]